MAIGAPLRSATTGPCTLRRTVSEHIAQRAVRLPHLDDLGVRLERLDLAVEDVAAVLQHEAIEIRLGGIVRGLRPADVLGEALAQHREADPHGAVRRDARRARAAPRSRCGCRPTAGASCSSACALPVAERDGGDGPFVGAVRLDVGAREPRSTASPGLTIQS